MDHVSIVISVRSSGVNLDSCTRLLLHPATDLDPPAWRLIADGEPICLGTDVSRFNVGRTTWFTLETLAADSGTVTGRHGPEVTALFGRGDTTTEVLEMMGEPSIDMSITPPHCRNTLSRAMPGSSVTAAAATSSAIGKVPR